MPAPVQSSRCRYALWNPAHVCRRRDGRLMLDPGEECFDEQRKQLFEQRSEATAERSRPGVATDIERRQDRDRQVSHIVLPDGSIADTAHWGLSAAMLAAAADQWDQAR